MAIEGNGNEAFLEGFEEADRAYITEHGFNSNADLIGALKAADSKVAIPQENASAEEIAAFYGKLGRPESADKYDLPVPDGDDGKFAQAVKPLLFEAGLSGKQATQLATAYNGLVQQIAKQKADAYNAQQAKEMEELNKEWGADADKNTEIARQAARKFGITDEAKLNALEHALGSKTMLTFLFNIGKTMMDDPLKGQSGASKLGVAGMTPQQAAAKMHELQNDKEFGKKFMANDPEAMWLFDEVSKAMIGGK